jgi:hypothetical protein
MTTRVEAHQPGELQLVELQVVALAQAADSLAIADAGQAQAHAQAPWQGVVAGH